MSQPLCRECGHPLPNAAGPGLYCIHCGTPVNPDEKPHQGHFITSYGQVIVSLHKITENDVLVAEVIGPNVHSYFASRSLDVVGQAVGHALGLDIASASQPFMGNTMKEAVEQLLALEQADALSNFLTKGRPHE